MYILTGKAAPSMYSTLSATRVMLAGMYHRLPQLRPGITKCQGSFFFLVPMYPSMYRIWTRFSKLERPNCIPPERTLACWKMPVLWRTLYTTFLWGVVCHCILKEQGTRWCFEVSSKNLGSYVCQILPWKSSRKEFVTPGAPLKLGVEFCGFTDSPYCFFVVRHLEWAHYEVCYIISLTFRLS